MIQENETGLECFEKNDHCTACLTGKYPVELEWQLPGADIIFQDTKAGEEVAVGYLHVLLLSWYSVKCHMLVSSEIFFLKRIPNCYDLFSNPG